MSKIIPVQRMVGVFPPTTTSLTKPGMTGNVPNSHEHVRWKGTEESKVQVCS